MFRYTLRSLSLKDRLRIFKVRFDNATLATLHSSASKNASGSSTERTILRALMLEKSIEDSFLCLSVVKIIYTT